jgi:hypothetical protein
MIAAKIDKRTREWRSGHTRTRNPGTTLGTTSAATWAAVFGAYVSDPSAKMKAIAERFGVNVHTVSYRAGGEKWSLLRRILRSPEAPEVQQEWKQDGWAVARRARESPYLHDALVSVGALGLTLEEPGPLVVNVQQPPAASRDRPAGRARPRWDAPYDIKPGAARTLAREGLVDLATYRRARGL